MTDVSNTTLQELEQIKLDGYSKASLEELKAIQLNMWSHQEGIKVAYSILKMTLDSTLIQSGLELEKIQKIIDARVHK